MKITNKFKLPEQFLHVANSDTYSRAGADLSVTQLLIPIRELLLTSANEGARSEDLSDALYSMLGDAVHKVMADVASFENGVIAEERLTIPVLGVTLTGQIDRQVIKNGHIELSDYKLTSYAHYKVQLDRIAKSARSPLHEQTDWVQQLNAYAYLTQKVKGIPVSSAKIICILRDWTKMRAVKDKNYPQAPVIEINIPLYNMQARYRYVLGRVKAILAANSEFEMNGTLPECTVEEMWGKADVFTTKVGSSNKSEHPNIGDALTRYKTLTSGGYKASVTYKPGDRIKCQHYCSARSVCDHALNREKEIERIKAMIDVAIGVIKK